MCKFSITLVSAFFIVLGITSRAQIQGTDDFRVNVETGVENTHFESDRMDLTSSDKPAAKREGAGILPSSGDQGEYRMLDTLSSDNSLPDPVTNHRKNRVSNLVVQSASAPQLDSPSLIAEGEQAEGGSGVFWAIIIGVGLVFIVLLLLLKGASGSKDAAKNQKRKVDIR